MTNLSDIIASNNVLTTNNVQTVTNKSIDASQLTGTINDARLPATISSDITGNAATASSVSTATTATNVTVSANNSTNETVYVTFVDGATGTQGIETDTNLNYNPSTNILQTSISGNAGTVDNLNASDFLRSNTSDNFTSGTLEFQDNTMLAFGNSADTIIEHDTAGTDGTRFYANTSNGSMRFQDGSTTCFDVAYTAANTTTFFQDVDFTNATVTGLGGGGAGATDGIFLEYSKSVLQNYTIDEGKTALTASNDSSGITIPSGVTVTIADSSGWVITGGDKNMGLDAMVATSNQTERTMRTGTIKPTLNNTYDLGDSAVAWRNIYTNDLNLSNIKSSGNEIDGTTGKWTIQEGEDDLFIINRRTGKKYKFMLEEIV